MKRRDLLKTAAAGAGVAAISAPAIASGKMEWRMATSWPKGLPGVYTGAERLAQAIATATGGRLTIKVYGAGEIVPAYQVFDAVSSGAAEMGHDAAYQYPNKSKAAPFFTTVPFGMTQTELNGWIYFGGGQALWDELYAPFNLKPFPAGNTGVQMGGWYRKEITSVEDFKGLKFRMPGLGGEVIKKMGATVVLLPGGEVFAALQSGAIDGTEWVGPYNDLSLGFYKVAPYYYWPGVHEPGSMLSLTVNKEKYDSLPNDIKQIVASCAAQENQVMASEYFYRSSGALDVLVRKHNVKLRQYSRDILVALGEAAGEVLSEILNSSDPMTRKVANSFLAARKDAMRWTRIADQGFANARLLNFTYPGAAPPSTG